MEQRGTLFVVHVTRQMTYVIEDILAMIAWTCAGRPYHVIVVDNDGSTVLHTAVPHLIIRSRLDSTALPGFHCLDALHQDLRENLSGARDYSQVIMLADTALIVSQGIDTFFAQYTNQQLFGVAGVGSNHDATYTWQREFARLLQLGIPAARVDHPDVSLCDDVLVFSGECMRSIIAHVGLLDECHKWSGTFGDYIAWLCYFNSRRVAKWGYTTKILPPLLVNNGTGWMTPPHLLSDAIGIVSPATNILGYSETDVRELYKRHRGEPFREIPKMQPIVYSMAERS